MHIQTYQRVRATEKEEKEGRGRTEELYVNERISIHWNQIQALLPSA